MDNEKALKKIRVVHILGAMYGVYYPYRKTPELYVAMKGEPVFHATCNQSFPIEQLPTHILGHDRRKAIRKLAHAGPSA